jgi:hypothetical protein
MHPLEKRRAAKAKKMSHQLEVRLKPGWRFDRRRRAIVSAEKSVSLRRVLPSHATVSLMAPTLANADPHTLSEDEALLARYLQVKLPQRADSTHVATALRHVDGMEFVGISPSVEYA